MAKKPNGKAAPAPAQPSHQWPADRIVRLKVDSLAPYARNSRLHTSAQVAQIAEAIKRFGWTNPVIVDKGGEIVAGHGRVLAAQRLKLKTVPGIVLNEGEWSEQDKRAYRIWDNQSTLLSEWVPEMLRIELSELKADDYPLELTGFDNVHLVSFLAVGGTDPEQEWAGMPEFNQQDKTPFRSLWVHFRDKAALDEFIEFIGIAITDKTRFIWIPESEPRESMSDKRYVGA